MAKNKVVKIKDNMYKLNIQERLNLIEILPEQGDYSTLYILRNLRESLSFTEEEHKKWKLTPIKEPSSGRILGYSTKNGIKINDTVRTIKIGPRSKEIIVESFKKLNDEKKLTTIILPLYERFVKPKDEIKDE